MNRNESAVTFCTTLSEKHATETRFRNKKTAGFLIENEELIEILHSESSSASGAIDSVQGRGEPLFISS